MLPPKPNKFTSFTTVASVVLKELRLEQGLNIVNISDVTKKIPREIIEIELAKKDISLSTIAEYSMALSIPTSIIFGIIGYYCNKLVANGWFIATAPKFLEKDDLITQSENFWRLIENKPGIRKYRILDTPYLDNQNGWISDIFAFLFIEKFRIDLEENEHVD